MWCNEKKILTKENQLERQQLCQQLLKQVKTVYEYYYENKEVAEKEFENWLIQQVYVSENNITRIVPGESHKLNKSSTKLSSISSSNLKQQNKTKTNTQYNKPGIDWNFSVKVNKEPYKSNLNDFFPRDIYTMMPTDADLVFLNKELKNQSIEKVKYLIEKDFTHQILKTEKNSDREVVYKPKNVIDTPNKAKGPEECDTTGLHLTSGDPKSYSYKKVKSIVSESTIQNSQSDAYGNHQVIKSDVKNIKALLGENKTILKPMKVRNDEMLNIIEKSYGKDLSDFMENKRHGKVSQKYEKVFIC